MDIEEKLKISYYKPIADIDKVHGITLVQHAESGNIYIQKTTGIYNIDVYNILKTRNFPGVPHIHELFEENGQLTIIEDQISGETLQDRLDKHIALSPEEACRLIISLCNILKPLHENIPPIIHRDIKPSNIMLTPGGGVVLLDLNAAKFFDTSKESDTRLLGTQGYAAPEQYGFGPSRPETDIYALGILLKELTGNSAALSPDICAVTDRCTKLDPSERYHSVSDLEQDLSMVLYGKSLNKRSKLRFPYLPPGFRNPSLLKSLLVTPGYLILILLCTSLTVENGNTAVIFVNRAIALLMNLSIIFFTFDYLNVQSTVPLCRSKKLPIRLFGILLIDAMIFVVSIILLLCLEAALR